MDVVQVPGSIFLHIGDQLEFLTGGKYAATVRPPRHLQILIVFSFFLTHSLYP